MALLNTKDGYGTLTKFLHWAVVALFVFQFVAAHIMVRLDANETALGLSQNTYYNWHKSIGLVALAAALFRVLARRRGELPSWAPTLRLLERRFIHRVEQLLYTAMFVMPVSGLLFVMVGGYGVRLFGLLDLPNPIGENETLATVAMWTHIVSSYLLLVLLASHIGLVLGHQIFMRDRLLHRMLPGGGRSRD